MGDEVDCYTEMAEPSGPTDSVQVSFRHLREVEVDDNVDSLDVDTASQQVGADQVPAKTGSEVVEDAVPENKSMVSFSVHQQIYKLNTTDKFFRKTNR